MSSIHDAGAVAGGCRADRIITAVCRQLDIAEEHLRGRGRTLEVAGARQLACYVLARAGYPPGTIARRLQRDHSTILHALRRVEDNADLAAHAQTLVACIMPFAGEMDDDWPAAPVPHTVLVRALLAPLWEQCSLREVRAVRAYVLGSLLGWERAPAVQAHWGLRILASRPGVRQAVEAVLRAGGLGAYGGLIALQAAHAGLVAA